MSREEVDKRARDWAYDVTPPQYHKSMHPIHRLQGFSAGVIAENLRLFNPSEEQQKHLWDYMFSRMLNEATFDPQQDYVILKKIDRFK